MLFFLNDHYIFKKTKLQSYDLLNIIIILRTATTTKNTLET